MTRQVFVNIPSSHSDLDVLCKDSTRQPIMDIIQSELESEFPGYDIDVQPAYKKEDLAEVNLCESDEKMSDKAWFTLKECILKAALKIIEGNMELAEISNSYYE